MTDPPLNFDPEKIDFSQFHDLEHRPWGSYCRSRYPGGWWSSGWHHVTMSWEYKWSPEVRRLTLCRVGRHHHVTWTRGRLGHTPVQQWVACVHCLHRPDGQVAPE